MLVEDRYQEVLCFPPDATEEKCNAESLADDGEGEDVTADVLAAVEDAVLVGAVAARPPLLAGVVEQFAHGHWTRDGAKQSDQQPLDTQSQTAGEKMLILNNLDNQDLGGKFAVFSAFLKFQPPRLSAELVPGHYKEFLEEYILN